ncbi:PotD/PotF family extracellular solute-binding protein [Siccirubricoccus sp. KC 17139]|uniref:PotD/PotF family extracellular solute-binding protein n=1 Tax=Siccirubricoccus soli TaxID=2899147 RepID=A0ABT1D5S6_9PROT|nr:PotD/PotF family extracellular solute-binding protein [Siccirubricoccus soli]MCO6417277.1 PotD/PotF family extracellular solute-binding protein [Siccirubricoccus soli]MCP2683412.1 PotD/PotF family extracellular solute-binding protein [Siccirubricoccus soli]
MSKPIDPPAGHGRRGVLKAALGAAAGSGTLGGFPTIWAQNIRDVVLQHAGPPVTAIGLIADQATKDLGFTVRMQASENADLLNRFLSQSSAIDVADVSITFMKYLVGRNVLQGIPRSKMQHWDVTIPLFTKGRYPDGRVASTEGVAPYGVLYLTDAEAKAFAPGETEWLTGVPSVTNADTLGIRPDLTGRPITSWADLLDPAFKGRAALQDQPAVGTIDVAMAVEARGGVKYGNKGNMTRAEIDRTMAIMMDIKRSGQFRSFWTTFDQSVNLMASGEVVIQSMWSPAVSAVRTRGIPCIFQPLKEGYRGWGYTLGMMKHLTGLKRDCAIEYANWYGSGFQGAVIARQGYYSTQPENVRKFLTSAEWDYWYDGKPAAEVLPDPFGKPSIRPGEVRDGGSFEQRMGNIAVWNSVMDEDRYLTRKWNEFITS